MTLLLILALQDELYRFKPETAWTYARVQGGEEKKISAAVVEDRDGQTLIDWRESKLDGSEATDSEILWIMRDGILWAEARGKGDAQAFLRFPVLKAGSKKDDTWTTDVGESRHHGLEELKVPAGSYKEVVRTQLKISDGTLVDFYLAPKVGLVKVSVVPSAGDPLTLELKEFKPSSK